jgi:hypothetical protein
VEDAYVSASVSLTSLLNAGDSIVMPSDFTWNYNYEAREEGELEALIESQWATDSTPLAWPSGRAPIGFDTGAENTVLPDDIYETSALFRTQIDVRCCARCACPRPSCAFATLVGVLCAAADSAAVPCRRVRSSPGR